MSFYKENKIDSLYLILIILLTFFGFGIFLSASLGILALDNNIFSSITLKQGISLFVGLCVFFVFSKISYDWFRKSAFYIMLGAIFINLLLFVPSLAIYHGGASRWLDMGFISFQPSELLKIAVIIYVAAWLHFIKDKIKKIKYGILFYLIIMSILGVLLITQSDTDTLLVIGVTTLVMFFVAGMPLKHVGIIIILGLVIIGSIISIRAYAKERFLTYLNKGRDVQGSGYQINQSMIAIGSGQILGRGFGQSIQKFGYLPQPTNDSIFAVAAEEFGFVGSIGLVLLYILLVTRIFTIATKARDVFGSYLAVGLGTLILSQSFLNMGAMLGITPLSGLPLLFISHGGTALVIILATAGIVANISKTRK